MGVSGIGVVDMNVLANRAVPTRVTTLREERRGEMPLANASSLDVKGCGRVVGVSEGRIVPVAVDAALDAAMDERVVVL